MSIICSGQYSFLTCSAVGNSPVQGPTKIYPQAFLDPFPVAQSPSPLGLCDLGRP